MYSLIALAFYFFASILSAVHVSAKPFESPRIDNALSRRGAGILTTSGNGTGNASTALGYGTGNASMAYGYGAGNASLAYGNTSVPGLMASNISGEDNCHGSWYCGHSPIFTGGVVLTDCIAASEKFSEYEVYARFTQYAVGHCAAIFNCIPSQYYAGPTVQALFDHIYQVQPCKKCGEHYFNKTGYPENSCMVKFNYCYGASCQQKGGPPDAQAVLAMGPEELGNYTEALAGINQTLVNGIPRNNSDLGNVTTSSLAGNISLNHGIASGDVQTS